MLPVPARPVRVLHQRIRRQSGVPERAHHHHVRARLARPAPPGPIAAPALADDAPIDMDKIRALAAKKGSMDMSLPGLGKDPAKDKALVDVVLGANGAVVRLDPDEVREMERIGFLVKDSFRGKAPDFWSLRDFQPRNWFSEPVDRFYGMSVAGFTAPASDRSAANEQYAASLRRSVAEKVAAVASQPSPDNWEPPVKDDGKYCGYGDYRSLCSEKTKGQPAGSAPPSHSVSFRHKTLNASCTWQFQRYV